MFRVRKTENLRFGRRSVPGANYFVTTCTAGRQPILDHDDTARLASEALTHLAIEGDVAWIAGTVMPDHIHAVFQLGERLSLDRVIAKLKAKITRQLRRDFATSIWQENVFEHRLRSHEDPESYAFYIFMNPYRAELCPLTKVWPWWVCTAPERFRFLSLLNADGSSPVEWLQEAERISTQIVSRAG